MIHSIYPRIDSTIYEEYPNKNTGLDAILDLSKKVDSGSIYNNRILLKFDITSISASVASGTITNPQYYLNLYTIEAQEIPTNYTIEVYPISQSWDAGIGRYPNAPEVTNGVSWYNRLRVDTNKTPWTTASFAANTTGSYFMEPGGGVWYSNYTCTQSYDTSLTDIRVDVTSIVNAWISGTIPNEGFIIKKSYQDEVATDRYEILSYFSSNSQTVYAPKLEVAWDNTTFTTGSLTQPGTDKELTLYLPNLKSAYSELSKLKLNVRVREKYPTITFATQSNYLTVNYIPSSSFEYSVRYADTDEVVIPFDSTYTKVSCDSNGNYINLWLDGLFPEKYYKFVFKVVRGTSEEYYDNNYIFKVTK